MSENTIELLMNNTEILNFGDQIGFNSQTENQELISIHDDTDTIYNFLLNELFNILKKNESVIIPGIDEKVSTPDIEFNINKRTAWLNFRKNCKEINRDEAEVCKFFKHEYQVQNSVNVSGHMLIVGRYKNMINTTFKKYIKNHVQCSICKSIKTKENKNHHMGLDYLICLNCKTEKPIKR